MHGNFSEDQIKKAALYAGGLALLAGIGMAFEYGRAMSWLHAVSLSLLAIAGSIGFVGADILRSKDRKAAASVVTVATIGLLCAEYGTHFGYTVGHRVRDAQETTVQNVKYDGARESVAEAKASLKTFEAQLATLMEKDAWTATVKADGLRDELATLKERMAAEEKGQRGRKAGRGKEFEALQNRANDLALKIGKVEQREDLTSRIEATKRVITAARDKADHTEFKSSKIVNQTAAFAQIAMWDDKPSESSINWTQLVLGAVIAAVTTYLAPFFFSIAFSDIREAARKLTHTDVQARTPTAIDRLSQGVSTLHIGQGPARLVMTSKAY